MPKYRHLNKEEISEINDYLNNSQNITDEILDLYLFLAWEKKMVYKILSKCWIKDHEIINLMRRNIRDILNNS